MPLNLYSDIGLVNLDCSSSDNSTYLPWSFNLYNLYANPLYSPFLLNE